MTPAGNENYCLHFYTNQFTFRLRRFQTSCFNLEKQHTGSWLLPLTY